MSFDDNLNSSYGTTETVYGTHEELHRVLSEKVQALAGSIYREFEQMIVRYGEDAVKTLMPLLVNILECLDTAYKTNQVYEVDLELYREDNEQLMTQYEREKAARKISEQKLLECEDLYEGDKKKWASRIESMESIHRMMELKNKNLLDHISRLEDRENDLKKEYAKLHDRYTDLFKTHMDYMERTKLLLSTASDRGEVRGRLGLNPVGRSSGEPSLLSYGFASLEDCVSAIEQTESIPGSPVSLSESPPSPPIGSELAAVKTVERAHQTDPVTQQSQATSPVAPPSKSQTKIERRSGNTLYQELAFNDTDGAVNEGDDGMDITGCYVHPGEYASSVNDNYFGMGKEVENLILENNELLATKNALNVVKDDLIVKVDELTGEQEILREKVANLSAVRETLRERVTQLEEELRHLKETMSNNAGGGENEDDADVPMSQRRRFTRVEMARVLMERNQYKERFIELQDAVRYTEMVRASRVDTTMDKKNKQSIWKLFSNLFSTSERPQRPLSTPHLRSSSTQPAMRHSRTQADFLETQLTDHQPRRHDSADHTRQVRAHVRKEDGRTHAYGWSLPSRQRQEQEQRPELSSGGIPVPVPVYCRPVAETEPRMTLLCAAGVNLSGGRTPDGGCMVGESVFYATNDNTMSLGQIPLDLNRRYRSQPRRVSSQPRRNIGIRWLKFLKKRFPDAPFPDELTEAQLVHSPEIEQIDRHIQATQESTDQEKNLSSLVWICSNTLTNSVVMTVDANNPAEVIESFTVADKLILCVASVPGASAEDYKGFEERRETEEKAPEPPPPSKNETENKTEADQEGVVVGSAKLVQATILTPPSTPVKPPPNPEAATNKVDVEETNAPESPPLSSTPVHEKASSPEPAVDAIVQEQTDIESRTDVPADRQMSTVMATMWLGTKSGNLYVHSAVANYSKCLVRVKLSDAILSIVWCAGRCVVALADGSVAIFSRQADGQWDFSQYWHITLGSDKCSVRCVCAVGMVVWCGYRNRIHVVDVAARTLLHSLEAHPRHESQIRQLAAHGDGVWVSIKMDSTLRLYHAHTYQHLCDVDIEPYVSKMLGTGKLGFSLVRITALLISSGRLWIGTSNGVVISVPLSEGSSRDSVGSAAGNRAGPAQLSRARSSSLSPSNIPWCSMAHAQLSFHGHRDAVTFFVAVPAAAGSAPRTPEDPRTDTPTPPMLVISGGEGYIDFRIVDNEMEDSVVVAEDGTSTTSLLAERASKSHLIVWQVATA